MIVVNNGMGERSLVHSGFSWEKEIIGEIIRSCDEDVYLPSDDTYLMVRYLINFLRSFKIMNTLEIGSGSGFIACLICRDTEYLVLTDIDPASAECTYKISQTCGCGDRTDTLICRSGGCFRDKSFDLIYSNPPYLPCDDDIRVCGGSDGVSVALDLLSNIRRILRDRGVALMLLSSLGDLRKFLAEAHKNGYIVKVVDKLRKFFEILMVLMIMRRNGY